MTLTESVFLKLALIQPLLYRVPKYGFMKVGQNV